MIADIEELLSTVRPGLARHAVPGRLLLAGMADQIAKVPVPWTVIHGDFKPENLFVDHDRILGLDVGLLSPNAGVIDLAHFENHLESLLLESFSVRYLWAGHDLLAAFERGYRRDEKLQFPAETLAWMRLYQALRLLLIRPTWSSPLKSWIGEWQTRYLIHRLMSKLKHSGERGA